MIGQIVDDGAGGTIFSFISDIENVVGGFGDDTITGNNAANVFTPGAGNNTVDGRAGADTLVLDGTLADFLVSFDQATTTFTFIGANGTTIARNVESFRFTDVTRSAVQLRPRARCRQRCGFSERG